MKRLGRFSSLRAGAVLLAMLLLCSGIWVWFHSRESEAPTPASPPAAARVPAPDIHFSSAQNSAGTEFSLQTLRGTPVLIHFWATWCGPCVRELPVLTRQITAFRAMGLSLVVISEDTNWNFVRQFLARYPKLSILKHEALFMLDSDHKAAQGFQSTLYPETYLLDRDLNIVHKFTGAQDWSHPEMREFLAEAIRSQGSP